MKHTPVACHVALVKCLLLVTVNLSSVCKVNEIRKTRRRNSILIKAMRF